MVKILDEKILDEIRKEQLSFGLNDYARGFTRGMKELPFSLELIGNLNFKYNFDSYADVFSRTLGRAYAKTTVPAIWNLIVNSSRKRSSLTEIIADGGCGTGDFLIGLAKVAEESNYVLYCQGYDISSGQIRVAEEKYKQLDLKKKIYWFRRDIIREMETPKQFTLVTMTMDVLNNLESEEEWYKAFKNVYSSLFKDGSFIFDMNTRKRLTEDWNENTFILNNHAGYLFMQLNSKEPVSFGDWVSRDHLLFGMTFNPKTGKDYKAGSAMVRHYAPPQRWIYDKLDEAGFSEVYDMTDYFNGFGNNFLITKNRKFIQAIK